GAHSLAVAVLLRLAGGCRLRVPGRPASLAKVVAVRRVRRRVDGPSRAVVGAVADARAAVLGCAEPVPASTARRLGLPEAADLDRCLRKSLRRRGGGASSIQTLPGDRAAANALAGLCGVSDPVGSRV